MSCKEIEEILEENPQIADDLRTISDEYVQYVLCDTTTAPNVQIANRVYFLNKLSKALTA